MLNVYIILYPIIQLRKFRTNEDGKIKVYNPQKNQNIYPSKRKSHTFNHVTNPYAFMNFIRKIIPSPSFYSLGVEFDMGK